jgi:mono/diheme cytochrome c family protein
LLPSLVAVVPIFFDRIAMFRLILALSIVAWTLAVGSLSAAPPSAVDLEFFEKRIRPIFAEHCYECHAGDEVEGGLNLDTSSGWLGGGDSGPAIEPGRPEESLIVEAIRYGGHIEMPPTGKLPDEKIRLIEQWIARGAPAPLGEVVQSKAAAISIEDGRRYWAYQPVKNPPLPELTGTQAVATPIDRFVEARLDAAGLEPQPEADAAVLVRRLYFDLIGLPPTPDKIDRFLNDSSPSAYERLVDRLLQSPHFGERWGRHWLDVVRFAESLTLRGFVLPEAWRYRDYVIESFNEDRPYDEFLKEQIAGDLLPADSLEDSQRKLVATTFLALGNTNLEEQDKRQLDMDVVDEQLDVLGKAMLGQTIGCARCHDHKFDPIPTRDYYALAGILRNTQALAHENVSKWMEVPLPLAAEEESRLQAAEKRVAELNAQVADARRQLAELEEKHASNQPGPAVVAPADLPGIVVDDAAASRVGEWMHSQHSRRYIGDGYLHDIDQAKGEKTLTFVPALPNNGIYEVQLAYTPGDNRADNVPVTVFSADGEKTLRVNMRELPPLGSRWISLGQFQCEAAGQNFVLVANEGTNGHVIADAVQYLPVDVRIAGDDVIEIVVSLTDEKSAEVASHQRQLKELERELDERRKQLPKRPKALTVVERKEITDAPVHIRGSVHTLGEVVPRGFLQVVAPTANGLLPANESGRRQLAEWVASPDNPLTARVMANRIWHWLLGEGLVRTVDNFGTTGELPSHPELLDHLAARFVAEGWSVKRLVRNIVLSDTYRRSSEACEAGMRVDPENRLLWRANRKRLEAECLRDAMLLVAGRLDPTQGGPTLPTDLAADFGYLDRSTRRSVYVPVLRNSMCELLEVFDFPDSSMVVGSRNRSTVATQALFMMNDPFVHEQARAAARQLVASRPADDRDAITIAFRQALGRAPSDPEIALAERVLGENNQSRELAWANLYHMLFASVDFRYRD